MGEYRRGQGDMGKHSNKRGIDAMQFPESIKCADFGADLGDMGMAIGRVLMIGSTCYCGSNTMVDGTGKNKNGECTLSFGGAQPQLK